jgi:hypothetical protein
MKALKSGMFDVRDFMICGGLSLMGTGLFFLYGLGVSLTVEGAVITAIAVFGR